MKQYIAALDQGTTSSRCIIFDREQHIVGSAQREFTQLYPQPGWVEHDPMEIWSSQYSVLTEALAQTGVAPEELAAIGITNQRETTVVWDKETGRPIYNAIVWQCRRTAGLCEELKRDRALTAYIQERTGLLIDAYFSATKLKWILDRVEGARERARRGELCFGTVDSWLVWKLTGGKVHVTDYTNASRTMLFDIRKLAWDEEICRALDIPMELLPTPVPSSRVYGAVNLQGVEVPIAGMAGDQQAALFGQTCFGPGEAKNTYGTGCFLLMNTGERPCRSQNGLVTTVAASGDGRVRYALEGSVFVGGAVIQWLRDELRFLSEARDAEYYASKVPDTGGVYLVPAFTGLGPPTGTCTPGEPWWASPGGPPGSTSSGRPRSPSPIRWPTWWRPWRRTRASPCPPSTPTAGPAGTAFSCSSKRTSWTGPSCARRSPRPPPWGRRGWPAWRWGCGAARMSCGGCGPCPGNTGLRWRRTDGRPCSGAGTRRWAAAWTGPTTSKEAYRP